MARKGRNTVDWRRGKEEETAQDTAGEIRREYRRYKTERNQQQKAKKMTEWKNCLERERGREFENSGIKEKGREKKEREINLQF